MSLLANSNAIETGGYQISRSVRIRASATPYFDRTPASTSGNNTWTFSCWVKRGSDIGSTSTQESIMGAGDGGGAPARYDVFGFYNDTIQFFTFNGSAASIYTTAVFRDPSAWYHLVCRYDDTQATASNRVRIYVNGVLQTLNSPTYPNQNYGSNFNTTYLQRIAANTIATNRGIDGYLAEVIMVSGQSLDPSSFGETDPITGSWVAKKYTGSYGTNGFFLTFADNSAATSTTIGKDYSGNGNNWTPNNISVTAGTTYDSMLDVPSGSGYADGGNGRGNYATLNPLDTATSSTLTNGNLTNTLSTGSGSSQASTVAMTSGKWYWEVSESSVTNQSCGVGILRANLPATVTRDSNPGGVYYVSGGSKFIDGTNTSYGTAWGSTGVTYVIGVALDLDAGTVTFYLNNTSQGAITLPSNTYGWRSHAIWSSASGTGTFETNFGQRPFSYLPTGFKALNTTNLSDPTVKDGGDYFNTVLWTGNDATRTITGYGFQPDFIWTKGRNVAAGHRLSDVVRGASGGTMLNLNTASTAAENTDTAVTGFASDGFTMNGTNHPNVSPYTYVGWGWKANGTGVTNTAGSITSTVSANTTSGFSIVTYTGTGANATVGHGLGVAPSMYIVKRRTGGIGNWAVWHTGLSNTTTSYILLDSTAAQSTSTSLWGSTAATSTTLGIGTSVTTNNSTDTYVAYCFSSVNSYSSFGSFVGNGSTNGPLVFCGFRPRFIFWKNASTTGDWQMKDSSRSTYNVTSANLYANLANAENSAGDVDFLSNGFKLRSAGTDVNGSGNTIIYAAFAENPFKYSNAR